MVESFAHDSPLRFGAIALGQQVDMWLRLRLRPNSPSVNFTYPKNIIRNAVPKKDKKEGRENLKTEKVFIWKKSLPNNHEVVTTEQETGCSKARNFDYT